MECLKEQVIQGVTDIAIEKINILLGTWRNLFEPEIGKEHLEKLLDHVDAFFTDIIVETQHRERAIRDRIDNLNREKQELKRLLKEEVDDVSTQNIPLFTLQMNIDEGLKSLRNKLQRRHDQIETYLLEQNNLCEELDEPRKPLSSDPLPSEGEMIAFRNHLEAMRSERYLRFDKITSIRDEIKQLMKKLEITVLDPYDENLLNDDNVKPTSKNIDKLNLLLECFVTQYDQMKYQIGDMRKRLAQLWKYLDIPEAHHKKFGKYVEITQTTYDKLHFEMQRCEQIKKENIRVFIERVRNEIHEYWDKCMKSEAERMRFPSYTANIFNEDVLELHEDELRDLKMFYENNEGMFNMVKERQELWSQMDILLNKESDPKRYNNRGGQLLKEEKERKMILIKLPKIESKLIEMAEKFEEENNRSFTVFGVRIQDIIEKDYEIKRQEKLTKSGRKLAVTPSKTPGRSNMTTVRTPLTVEQTFVNRTALKTTGGRLNIKTTCNQRTLCNTTSSSTVSSVASVRTATGKRKIVAPPCASAPQAKRKLLGDFVSPASGNVLKPLNGNASNAAQRRPAPLRNNSLKIYNVGSVIKRRSKSMRKSIGKKGKSAPKKIPSIVVNSTEETITSNTTSYEGFENYVYKNKSVVRSSEVARPHFLTVNHHGFASPVVKKPTPARRMATPSASTPTSKGIQPRELEFSMII